MGARTGIEISADGSSGLRRFTLGELLAEMTPEREHDAEDDGPRGEELL